MKYDKIIYPCFKRDSTTRSLTGFHTNASRAWIIRDGAGGGAAPGEGRRRQRGVWSLWSL